jgi:DNA-binding GntR family transcriptional regulator
MTMPGKNNVQKMMNSKGEANLTYMVYHKIKEMMSNYDIIPGQRLVFVDLANQLGVSRTPVNNALSILANEGFLDFVPHQGYTVHQITREEAECLYEVREIMELGAIGKAIRGLTPENRQELDRKKSLYEKAVEDQVSRGRFILDQEFHSCYIRISGNHYLADYFNEVYQRIFLRHRIEGLGEDRAQEVVKEHEEIFHAISLRDIEGAKELIRKHIKAGKEYIFSVIFDETGEKQDDDKKG